MRPAWRLPRVYGVSQRVRPGRPVLRATRWRRARQVRRTPRCPRPRSRWDRSSSTASRPPGPERPSASPRLTARGGRGRDRDRGLGSLAGCRAPRPRHPAGGPRRDRLDAPGSSGSSPTSPSCSRAPRRRRSTRDQRRRRRVHPQRLRPRIVFAEDEEQVAKLRRACATRSRPRCERVVAHRRRAPRATGSSTSTGWPARRTSAAEHPTAVDDAVGGGHPDHLATLIYTSGTTGRPKGVGSTHDTRLRGRRRRGLGILHRTTCSSSGCRSRTSSARCCCPPLQIGFSTAVDGRIDRIVDNLAIIKPTFMAAAPRIFEKAYARVA